LIGQIITVYKDRYLVEYNDKKIMTEVSGRFKYLNYQKSDYPQIGDFVKFHLADEYLGIIEQVLERKNTLDRQDVGKDASKHILAANIDICFICMSLNKDFNEIKLRNLLNLTLSKDFKTIVLLTKKDLCDEIDYYLDITKKITDNEILITSAYERSDLDLIEETIKDQTAVFIGSSGVGKSTIINHLLGDDHFKTNEIRLSDAQGRHTTVNRELLKLKSGGKVIDTPGIRIITSYFVDEASFEDILLLSEGCRYNDCKHEFEPGCMIKKALRNNELDWNRYNQYLKAIKTNEYNQKKELEKQRMLNKRRPN
jgi:ribosome biogenesis GTPase